MAIEPIHPVEPHGGNLSSRLNWLRAGVLGANDGIVSIAAVVVGVASATNDIRAITTAGTAAVVGGAISMALGEYVSVSSAKDNQVALIAKEKQELKEAPEAEFAELVGLYQNQGLSRSTALRVATELTEKDALTAHLRVELGIDTDDIASPWHAAFASAIAFLSGAILPMIAILLFTGSWQIPGTVVATLIALAITGATGAKIGGAPVLRATTRVLAGGALALAATYFVGSFFETGPTV